MWTISLLKRNAWNSLKNYYWTAFGVCLLAAIITGTVSGSAATYIRSDFPVSGMLHSILPMEISEDAALATAGAVSLLMILLLYIVIFAIALAFSMVLCAFLSNPLEAGKCAFFCRARNGNVQFVHLFSSFMDGKYMATVKLLFWRMLYTWLWSLLFVIPGIIKGLEYTLIPYLVTENPYLSKERVFEISRRTMEGEKWDFFVLQLSFFGWYLLGMLTCGFGLYFVLPYQQATTAEFYACMRAKMIAQGITTEEELTGGIPVQA